MSPAEPAPGLRPSSTRSLLLTVGILIAVATVFVLAVRATYPTVPEPPAASDAPEQVLLRTGPERQFLSDLSLYVDDVGASEDDYLSLGRAWCDPMRAGGAADEVLGRMPATAELLGLPQGTIRAVAGVATLRLCPEQGSRLEAYYRGR